MNTNNGQFSPVVETTSANARKSRLLTVSLFGYVVLVLVLGWSFAVRQIRNDRELTLESSSDQLTMTATALAKHVEAMINDGVGAAVAGANEMSSLDRKGELTSSGMPTVLARMLTGGDYVNTLFILTPSTFVSAQRNASSTTTAPPVWARELLASTQSAWVGKPVNVGHGDDQVLIPIAKRVASIHGEITWAGALFSVVSLDAMYRSLPAERSSVSLISEDAIMLIRIPINPARNFAGIDITHMEAHQRYIAMPKQALSTLQAPDPFTGKPRQYVARRVQDFPIVAVAGRNVEDSLIAWRARTRASVWMFSIASLVMIALTIVLYVVLQRRFVAITRSEQRFQLAVKGTNDGIWEWEMTTDHVYHSPRFKELLGYADTDEFAPSTRSFWERIHPDDARPTELALQRHLLHRDPYDVQFRLRTRSGEYRWFCARAQALWDEQGNAFRMAGSISDIDDRKTAERELEKIRNEELHAEQEFAQRLLLAQEQERQRLANELHDSVGQNLSLIKNRALLMMQQAELSPAITRHAASLEQLATEVISEVRAVAQNLRPLHIDELGLTSVVDSLLEKVNESGALQIEKRLENVDDALTGEAATHVFRIIQEAINNVIKHARASLCRVTLERDIHCIRLSIADNGGGFDVAASHGRGLGLASLQERCRMLSATLKLNSIIGSGTTIHVEYPVPEHVAAIETMVSA